MIEPLEERQLAEDHLDADREANRHGGVIVAAIPRPSENLAAEVTGVQVKTERDELIAQYEAGPARLKAALATVPPEAIEVAPGRGRVVRPRDRRPLCRLGVERGAADPLPRSRGEPGRSGYDQEVWARALDYHAHPLEPALLAVESARANTAPLLHRLPEAAWAKVGRHSESGTYSATRWLEIYAAHLEEHSRQIEANVAAWQERNR